MRVIVRENSANLKIITIFSVTKPLSYHRKVRSVEILQHLKENWTKGDKRGTSSAAIIYGNSIFASFQPVGTYSNLSQLFISIESFRKITVNIILFVIDIWQKN